MFFSIINEYYKTSSKIEKKEYKTLEFRFHWLLEYIDAMRLKPWMYIHDYTIDVVFESLFAMYYWASKLLWNYKDPIREDFLGWLYEERFPINSFGFNKLLKLHYPNHPDLVQKFFEIVDEYKTLKWIE